MSLKSLGASAYVATDRSNVNADNPRASLRHGLSSLSQAYLNPRSANPAPTGAFCVLEPIKNRAAAKNKTNALRDGFFCMVT